MGETSLKGAIQTQREQTHHAYLIQSAHSMWYGITRVHQKVEANHWCMRCARRCEGHGPQECYSPWPKESKCSPKVLRRRLELAHGGPSSQDSTNTCSSDFQRLITHTLSVATTATTAIEEGSVQTKQPKGGAKQRKDSKKQRTGGNKEVKLFVAGQVWMSSQGGCVLQMQLKGL